MKLIFSKDMNKLPVCPLPENAVMIGEPSKGLTSDLIKPVILTFILSIIIVELFCFLRGRSYDAPLYITIIAVAIFLLMIPLHEFLHIIALPKDVRKNITIILAGILVGVHYPNPLTKKRHLFVLALPNIIFTLIPFIIWLLYPGDNTFSRVLIHYLFFSIMGGAGDYYNILMIAKYVPKGAMIQNAPKDAYWFMESEKDYEEQ